MRETPRPDGRGQAFSKMPKCVVFGTMGGYGKKQGVMISFDAHHPDPFDSFLTAICSDFIAFQLRRIAIQLSMLRLGGCFF